MLPAAAFIAWVFKQDPLNMLSGDEYNLAIRYAAAKWVNDQRAGASAENLDD